MSIWKRRELERLQLMEASELLKESDVVVVGKDDAQGVQTRRDANRRRG